MDLTTHLCCWVKREAEVRAAAAAKPAAATAGQSNASPKTSLLAKFGVDAKRHPEIRTGALGPSTGQLSRKTGQALQKGPDLQGGAAHEWRLRLPQGQPSPGVGSPVESPMTDDDEGYGPASVTNVSRHASSGWPLAAFWRICPDSGVVLLSV